MGLMIIGKKDGTGADAHEFKRKVRAAAHLMKDICEDVEAMEEEYGDYSERSGYRGENGYRGESGYRGGINERTRYRHDDDIEMRRRYGY